MNATIGKLCALLAPLGLTSCSLFGGGGTGMTAVDDLLVQVEHLHVEAELSRQAATDALDHLHRMVAPGREAPAIESFAALVAAIERSEEQSEKYSDAIGEMEDAASSVFSNWETKLEEFASPTMRERSRARLEATRSRYDAVLVSATPARSTYESVNLMLRDHALFLEHDFNTGSVTEIDTDVRDLGDQIATLDTQLNGTILAVQTYLDSATPPNGRTVPTVEEVAPDQVGDPAGPGR